MIDSISRQAAIDVIFSEPLYESGMKKRDADAVVPAIYEKIKSLPSAQPERKKGKWVRWYETIENKTDTEYIPHCKCSECDTEYDVYSARFIKFCPNCGADMREEGEE